MFNNFFRGDYKTKSEVMRLLETDRHAMHWRYDCVFDQRNQLPDSSIGFNIKRYGRGTCIPY